MIDWSGLGRKRSGLFAAVGFRRRGLPLLSWVTTPEELNPSQNLLKDMFIRCLLEHLHNIIRPLLLADRGFGRASLLRFLHQMPRHTGRTVDYVMRVKGDVHIRTSDDYQSLLRKYPLRRRRYVLLPGVRYRSDGAAVVSLDCTGARDTGRPGIWRHSWVMPGWRWTSIGIECSRSSILRWIVPG